MRRAQPHEHRRAGGVSRRPSASQPATASPASSGNGRMSRRLPLPRTVISPCRQQMSPRSRAATSPARKPRRASSTKIAKSQQPAALSRSQLSISRASSAALTARGSAASCQHAADGTAPASGASDLPVQVKEPQQRPQARHRRLRRRHAAPGALAADEPRHVRRAQALRAAVITQGRPGQETAGHPRITADTVPGQAPLPGQVLPEPRGQPVRRVCSTGIRGGSTAPRPRR